MSAAAPAVYRVELAAPEGGWLTLTDPQDGMDRLHLAREWRAVAKRCAEAAGVPRLGRVRLRAEVRPQRLASAGRTGIHHQEDVRPSLHEALAGLIDAQVIGRHDRRCVAFEELVLGVPTGELNPMLVLYLEEVRHVYLEANRGAADG